MFLALLTYLLRLIAALYAFFSSFKRTLVVKMLVLRFSHGEGTTWRRQERSMLNDEFSTFSLTTTTHSTRSYLQASPSCSVPVLIHRPHLEGVSVRSGEGNPREGGGKEESSSTKISFLLLPLFPSLFALPSDTSLPRTDPSSHQHATSPACSFLPFAPFAAVKEAFSISRSPPSPFSLVVLSLPIAQVPPPFYNGFSICSPPT